MRHGDLKKNALQTLSGRTHRTSFIFMHPFGRWLPVRAQIHQKGEQERLKILHGLPFSARICSQFEDTAADGRCLDRTGLPVLFGWTPGDGLKTQRCPDLLQPRGTLKVGNQALLVPWSQPVAQAQGEEARAQPNGGRSNRNRCRGSSSSQWISMVSIRCSFKVKRCACSQPSQEANKANQANKATQANKANQASKANQANQANKANQAKKPTKPSKEADKAKETNEARGESNPTSKTKKNPKNKQTKIPKKWYPITEWKNFSNKNFKYTRSFWKCWRSNWWTKCNPSASDSYS